MATDAVPVQERQDGVLKGMVVSGFGPCRRLQRCDSLEDENQRQEKRK
jgi:hypothetical protein